MNLFPNSITATTTGQDNSTLTSEMDAPTLIKMLQTEKEMYMKRCQDLEMKVNTLEILLSAAKMQTEIQFCSFQERDKKHPHAFERPNQFREDETNTLYIHNKICKMFKYLKFRPENFYIWSEEPELFCHKICYTSITWPETVTKRNYWEKSMLPIINTKFSSLVNNTNQKMREQYKSK